MILHRGDCLEVLKQIEANSIDALITDPPAGISFMGKDWDSGKNFIPVMTEIFQEVLRCLKPGAHGLVWALPRTSHWTAIALENAGFEIRDVVTHLFGTGFPKSHNLGEGRGTALKPASEHWILVRKPISEKTVAANVLKWGTGGINIDECRIECPPIRTIQGGKKINSNNFNNPDGNGEIRYSVYENTKGRFPANLVLDEQAAEMLDEQSGQLSQCGGPKKTTHDQGMFGIGTPGHIYREADRGASRFFYVAKANKKDRGDGNNHPTVKSTKLMEYLIKLITPPNAIILDPFIGSGSTGVAAKRLGFQFIGIEKNEEYFKIAERRICANQIFRN